MMLEFREIDFANMLSAKCKQQGTGKWKLDAENRVENAWFHFTGWYVNLWAYNLAFAGFWHEFTSWLCSLCIAGSQSRVSSILICGLLHHILEAVKTIHEEWIVHSDLKPANFLLVKGELQLLDFGITKAGQNYTILRYSLGNPFQGLHIVWLWLLRGTIACVFMSGFWCVL